MSYGLPHGPLPRPQFVLAFGQQPTSGEVGNPISPAVTVQVKTLSGAVVTSFTGSVTIRLGLNQVSPPPNDGVLSGTLTVSAIAGVATYSNLTMNMHDGGSTGTFTLIASASGMSEVESNQFTQGWPI